MRKGNVFVTDKVNHGLDYISDSMMTPDNGPQLIFSEIMYIRATDKCGNAVELYYFREIYNEQK